MITLERAKELKVGDILHSTTQNNADGTPMRAKVNGKVKTWVRQPERVKIPYKRGLYEYGYLTEADLWNFKEQVND